MGSNLTGNCLSGGGGVIRASEVDRGTTTTNWPRISTRIVIEVRIPESTEAIKIILISVCVLASLRTCTTMASIKKPFQLVDQINYLAKIFTGVNVSIL